MWVGTDGDGVNRLKGNVAQHFDKDQGLSGVKTSQDYREILARR